MVQGTASDAGKSLLCTALCRIFARRGFTVAPFKSQNMALNSYVTADGKEIGRAQGVQAEACGIPATVDMNPILLKPKGNMTSQVVVRGVPIGDMSAIDYRLDYVPTAIGIIKDSLARLCNTHEVVVLEGAGSPVEINLKDRDITNMKVAELADAPVILVADIDRGGVFASIVGTLELLEPRERERVKGFVINKFRGDIRLLEPGLDWLEKRTGIPVLGVVPYQRDLYIESEDSVVLDKMNLKKPAVANELDVVVIRFPLISNFTDVDPLRFEPDVSLRFVSSPDELGQPDLIILPGTKNTVDDLLWLTQKGLAARLVAMPPAANILGICGGYQMLGSRLLDPDLVESNLPELQGLGLLDITTRFLPHKTTVQAAGRVLDMPGAASCLTGLTVEGYEIHMGRSERGNVRPFARLCSANGVHEDGAVNRDGTVIGTYLHGILHNDEWRRSFLDGIRVKKGLLPIGKTTSNYKRRMEAFDQWADAVETAIDMDRLLSIMKNKGEHKSENLYANRR
ncbi:cobyric acid synthase CobQ [Effusibacillus lacus]|uniref:Cobyric acid synthase n=2 Tax=Effusibacillus lacus TaxID=1348429 RepID=A0A292YCJ8_9BACL|nr:cobyric acid synthase CobQ [Effusibacillus lacus]